MIDAAAIQVSDHMRTQRTILYTYTTYHMRTQRTICVHKVLYAYTTYHMRWFTISVAAPIRWRFSILHKTMIIRRLYQNTTRSLSEQSRCCACDLPMIEDGYDHNAHIVRISPCWAGDCHIIADVRFHNVHVVKTNAVLCIWFTRDHRRV